MHKKTLLKLSALLLTTAATLHLIRSLAGWEVMVNGWDIPVWVSVILFALAGYLAAQMWKLVK